ncbi:MAG: selenide, water dikinase SelD [Cyanobacteria bacterium K_Offshore_0m_m2_072]|nr:selenide, water dikinase SelD [Cyanobacteria bacterium K_Offshore_0m_m2_072]
MGVDHLGAGRGHAAEHLILAGGGHSHALVLHMWGMQPRRRPNAWITLVSRGSCTLYSGMVPGLVAGLYGRDACDIDLRQLAERAGVSFVAAEITGVDRAGRQLLLEGRPPLRFDWLSLDVGAETATAGAPPDERWPIKPLEPFLAHCDDLPRQQALQVLGSGAAAVEVALALQARRHKLVLQTKPSGLDLGSAAANRRLEAVLRQAGIALNGPSSQHSAATIVCTGSRAPDWLAASGLPTGSGGRVRTDASLQVEGKPRLFASGDCGVIANDPRPPSGVWAVRAAPVLATNLERALTGRPLRRWRPQRRALQLLGDGGVAGQPRAIALWGPLAVGPSRGLWHWKDRIDRQFMARFAELGAMHEEAMACRGCAAKVGAAPLQAALNRLSVEAKSNQAAPSESARQPAQPRATPEPLANDDAALVARSATGDLLLQSVDGFPALVSDPWLNGRLTTLHACSDLWACGSTVLSAQAVVTLPQLGTELQADLLHQSLAGVRSVLDPLGAQLLGGHTLEARDAMPAGPGMPTAGLSLMLTVNGSVPAGRLWPKGPLHSGDALILVRPIGTGVLFAAAMARAAKPRWLDAAIALMQQSQAPLVELLAAHGCRACTDITGFGLLGHLGEMLQASAKGLRVELDGQALGQLALPGVLALLAAGHASTLAPSNASALALLDGPVGLDDATDTPKTATSTLRQLLIDPQTCGPLLAALPAAQAAAAIPVLMQVGFLHAAVIGRVVD